MEVLKLLIHELELELQKMVYQQGTILLISTSSIEEQNLIKPGQVEPMLEVEATYNHF